MQDVSCEWLAMSLNEQDIGSIAELGAHRCMDMSHGRKHLPLGSQGNKWQLWAGEQHGKRVVLEATFVAVKKKICFGFELFEPLLRIGREIVSYAKQTPEVISIEW